jgi:hypothetical protein
VYGFVSEREQSTAISVETGCEVRSGAEGVVRAVLVVGVAGAHFGVLEGKWSAIGTHGKMAQGVGNFFRIFELEGVSYVDR